MRLAPFPLAFIVLLSSLALGCGKSVPALQPTVEYSGTGFTVPALQEKKILVTAPISLKKLAEIDVEKNIAKEDIKRGESGEEKLSAATKYLLRNTPYYLTLAAQFSHILTDALNKSGMDAIHSDSLDMPAFTADNREETVKALAEQGFDYVLITGVEKSREKGKSIFTEEKHGAKNFAVRLATLGLVPVHSSTFSMNYDRTVDLVPTAPDATPFTQAFPTDYTYDETVNSLTHGFSYSERYARDLNAAQQKDIEIILDWMKHLDL